MPDNPVSGKAGNTARLNQLLSFFNDCDNLDVHYVSLKDWGMWKSIDLQLFETKYPNVKLHLLDKKHKNNFFRYFFLYKIPYLFKQNSIDLTSYILRKEFRDIFFSFGHFDTVLISYASWGRLIDKLDEKSYKIIDTHDFITAQNNKKGNLIGKMFQDEMNILDQYDEIWTYSIEEEYIFEQFTNKKVVLMPVSYPQKFICNSGNYKYDVLYVASENPHNIKGITWFLDNVLPYLNNIQIHIIGKIGNTIKNEYSNVVKYGVVDDLEDFYNNARMVICPMLSGTGVKIKVLEALSFGLPVVTNRRGVDGLINKRNNGCIVTEDPKEFAEAIEKLIFDNKLYELIRSEGISYFTENHNLENEKELINLSLQKKV